MPRKLRFAPPGYYLHITQRGNYRQRTFLTDRDHVLFLDLLALHADARDIDLLAYCQMSNHFHLIARGKSEGALSRFMQALTGQYAQSLHGRLCRRGRFWQERFYSCVLSPTHLVSALRYVELNPVRARIVSDAAQYPWSSAAIHCAVDPGGAQCDDDAATVAVATPPDWLDVQTFAQLRCDAAAGLGSSVSVSWREVLAAGLGRDERSAIRRATQWEIPLGETGFVERLEVEYHRKLLSSPVGRPPRCVVAA